MEAAGIEPEGGGPPSHGVAGTYHNPAFPALQMRCTLCGVEGLWLSPIDAGLRQLIEDWSTLRPDVRQAVLTLVSRE